MSESKSSNLKLEVRVLDMDFIKDLMTLFQQMLSDPEIPFVIREQYMKQVASILPDSMPP